MLKALIDKLEAKASFEPTWYGIAINPFFITRMQLFEKVSKFAKTTDPTDILLDVGCGAKPYEHLFKIAKYIGIDIKGGGLREDIKKIDKYFDGEKIPYPSNTFTLCMATEVLEHAKNPEKLIAEMHRVLEKNGHLFFTMPFVWPEHGKPYDFQRYTSFKQENILKSNGFKVISITPTTGIFGTVGQLLSDHFYNSFESKVWHTKIRYGAKFLLVRLLIVLICFPTQGLFEILDRLNKRRGITLDFAVIAKKI